MTESTDELGVGVAQFAPSADKPANLESITVLAERAAERGADLVVFPEYSSFFVDPVSEPFVAAAESLDGPFVAGIAALAQRLGVHIVAGMAEGVQRADRFANTVIAVDPSGAVVASYRKQHLYDAFGGRESDWVEPGELGEPEVFDIGGLTFGLQTCYDLRFPEITRTIVDAGAEVILVPAEWVRGPLKEFHWRTLATARAIENTVYLVAADHTPPIGVGTSLVIDPMGVPLVSLGETTDVGVGWISGSRLDAVRSLNPALELRRYRVTR